MNNLQPDLGTVFNPKSMALLGASGRPSAVSFTRRFLAANRRMGYPGSIYLINPNYDSIFDEKSWSSITAIPEPVDVAIISLPVEKVLPAAREAVAAGARSLMIHSGGFGERGAEGKRRQAELQALCRDANIPAIGPNCLGIISYTHRAALSSLGGHSTVEAGSIAAISQSGSIAGILREVAGRHGLSFLASTGNEAVTTAEDLISFAIDDPSTKVIVGFIEALRKPREIFGLADRAHAAGKPIILVKSGLTEQGGRVSRGHSGAFAGSGHVYQQALSQAGIVLAEDLDELAQTVELFAALKKPVGRCRVGVLATSGGELGLVADLAARQGLDLPDLAPATVAQLHSALYLPEDVVPQNPVDVGMGFGNPASYHDRMRACIQAVARDPGVDVVAVLQSFDRDNADPALSLNAQMLGAAAKEALVQEKAVVVMTSRSGHTAPEMVGEAIAAGVPALEGARESIAALAHLGRFARWQASRPRPIHPGVECRGFEGIDTFEDGTVSQAVLFPLLAQQGIAATPTRRATSAVEAAAAARLLHPPLAMKIDTGRVVHKSDVGGVVLGVDAGSAGREFSRLIACLSPAVGTQAGEGILIAEQVDPGVEFYVGARHDESFGAVVICGLGGRLLEAMDRTALLVAPFTEQEALDAMDRSGARKLLEGFRGGPVADLSSLARLLMQVGRMAQAIGERLDTLEFNPVIVNRRFPGGIVADARLILRK